MKKIILFLLLLISFSVFSQNPDRFRNGIRTQFVQPDTLSTANRDALAPKLGTIIFHKDTGFSRWEQWDGSDWVAFGGGSGSVNFASILGSPHDNANLGQSLDSTVHKWGNETIDSVKTFLRTIESTPRLVTVLGKNTHYEPFRLNGTAMLILQKAYWNGSAFIDASSFGFGHGAIANNQARFVTGGGKNAAQNNTGESATGFGDSALYNNSGINTFGGGFSAGFQNTGNNGTFTGAYAGRSNTKTDVTGNGFRSAYNNTGTYSTFTGARSGEFNSGNISTGTGFSSLLYNAGSNSNGFGYYTLSSNNGDRNNGFGNYALQYANGTDNNVFGNSSYSEFIPNISGNKTFGTSDVNTVTNQITVTAHNFGTIGAVVNLKLSGAGVTLGTGIGDGSVNKWEVADANTLTAKFVDITSTGTGTMTLTPQFAYSNVNILGNNLQPTQSDQTILGGATVVGPNTNKAAGIAGGNKVFLTREMADQLYTGGGGGGAITLPLDATDIADGSVTNTEFEYLNTVTSNIQTQLDGKLDPTDILDEDNMASNSDTHVPSQQSVKAYVDASDQIASEVPFTPTGTISSTDVQGAIAELDADISGDSGNYKFTTKSGNETLDSTIVKSATSGRFDKMWRTYTTNLAEITIPGNLPVGWSSVIEAGTAVDSILIKADTGVDIYGQGNSFVQSGTGIDGLWLKKGRTVALIYKGTNSVRAEGPWNVATLAPTQYNTILNAAGPGVYETNSTTGITMSGGGKGTWTSIASDSGSDAYMLNFAQNTIAGEISEYLNFTGIPTGTPLTVEIDVAGIGSPSHAEIDLETSKGWTVSQFSTISGTSRVTKTFTATANSATPSITIYDSSLVSGQGWKIYEVRITIAP